MSAKGTSWGKKNEWLRVITTGLQRLGGAEATLPELLLWLRSEEGRKLWPKRPEPLPEGTVKNYLTLARRAFGTPDGPWSIGQTISGKHFIDPLHLDVVLHVAKLARAWGRPLTTRQACWVARLTPIIQTSGNELTDESLAMHHYGLAMYYAAREQLMAIANGAETFDTSDIDPYLMFASGFGVDRAKAEEAGMALEMALKLHAPAAALGDELTDPRASGWIYTREVQHLRSLADSGVPKEQRIATWPVGKSVDFNLGLQGIASQPGFNKLSPKRQTELVKELRLAVDVKDWGTYRKLTGLKEVKDAKA
ncbi:MAG: hypothetical protein EXR57_05950 [Dehalococcoidia bacterium]|nr:hypothetical protein [Dehalococcoidia bacterium]MSQ35340.1 hypothetical protein [Dehalococcoidia bacterium]